MGKVHIKRCDGILLLHTVNSHWSINKVIHVGSRVILPVLTFLVKFGISFNSYGHKICRNSRSQMFFKIGVLKNFAIFTGKYLCWILFSIKFGGLAFSCEYCVILRTAFLIEQLWWLLVNMTKSKRYLLSLTPINFSAESVGVLLKPWL